MQRARLVLGERLGRVEVERARVRVARAASSSVGQVEAQRLARRGAGRDDRRARPGALAAPAPGGRRAARCRRARARSRSLRVQVARARRRTSARARPRTPRGRAGRRRGRARGGRSTARSGGRSAIRGRCYSPTRLPSSQVRCAYVDMDGTLLGPGGGLFAGLDGEVSLFGARALEACLRADVEVVVMSGRRRDVAIEDARLFGQGSLHLRDRRRPRPRGRDALADRLVDAAGPDDPRADREVRRPAVPARGVQRLPGGPQPVAHGPRGQPPAARPRRDQGGQRDARRERLRGPRADRQRRGPPPLARAGRRCPPSTPTTCARAGCRRRTPSPRTSGCAATRPRTASRSATRARTSASPATSARFFLVANALERDPALERLARRPSERDGHRGRPRRGRLRGDRRDAGPAALMRRAGAGRPRGGARAGAAPRAARRGRRRPVAQQTLIGRSAQDRPIGVTRIAPRTASACAGACSSSAASTATSARAARSSPACARAGDAAAAAPSCCSSRTSTRTASRSAAGRTRAGWTSTATAPRAARDLGPARLALLRRARARGRSPSRARSAS